MFTDTVSVEGAVPEVGVTLNQFPVLLGVAVQFSVPPPVFVMLTV